MKKSLAILLVLGVLFSVCACGTVDDLPGTEGTSTTTNNTTENTETEETRETTTETTHTHTFSDATCTAPKTCSCGATEGEATGHSYTKGVCTKCGSADPNYSEVTYVLNIASKKFHYTSCRRLPTDNRQDTTMSREEIIAQGYSPCGLCNP